MSVSLLFFIFFFFNDTATTEIYTLSLHDALPISSWAQTRTSPPAAKRNEDLARPRRSACHRDTFPMRGNVASGFPALLPGISPDPNRAPAPGSSRLHPRGAGSSTARWRIENWSTCAKWTDAGEV